MGQLRVLAQVKIPQTAGSAMCTVKKPATLSVSFLDRQYTIPFAPAWRSLHLIDSLRPRFE